MKLEGKHIRQNKDFSYKKHYVVEMTFDDMFVIRRALEIYKNEIQRGMERCGRNLDYSDLTLLEYELHNAEELLSDVRTIM